MLALEGLPLELKKEIDQLVEKDKLYEGPAAGVLLVSFNFP